MKNSIIIGCISLLLSFPAGTFNSNSHHSFSKKPQTSNSGSRFIDPSEHTVASRFLTPTGFNRTNTNEGTFAAYLRNLPLKPHGAQVRLFNGNIKNNHQVYDAVVNLEIGDKNLHQCADAVMRLRAEYLWEKHEYEKIHFNFTNGFRVDYSEWMKGKRVVVDGNKTHWSKRTSPSNSYQSFWNYLEIIFSYAGTLSLSKELKPIAVSNLEIGDVFIQGGSPGHAVIVVDMAENEQAGERVFLLAQSYMPAQETQILKNPNGKNGSPWYSLNFGELLQTPEWTFRKTDLKRFAE